MPARLRALAPLAAPDFRRLWLVGLCLATARWLDILALGWMALELTGSPLLVGVAAFCRTVPQLVLGPFGGVLADRMPRGRLLLGAQALALGASLGLVGLFASGRGSYAGLVLAELLIGAAWGLDFPVRRTVLFGLVGPRGATGALSLDTVSMQVGKMVGPLVGGVLLGRGGAVGCYAGLALLYALALGLTWTLRARIRATAGPAPAADAPGWAAGLSAVWARPTIRTVLVVTVVMNVLVFPYQQMLPVFARDVLRVGPELLGVMVTANGLGALLSALAIAGRAGFAGHRRLFLGGSAAAAVLLLGFTASPWYGLSLVLLFAQGLAESGFATMQSALVLLAAPARMRGRAMGILSGCIATQPFGTLWLGFLAGRVGASAASAAGAVVALACLLPVVLGARGGAEGADPSPPAP